MDQLPFELYPQILRHLDFYDLFRARAVCRRLNLAVKDFKIRELLVLWSGVKSPSKGNWRHTQQPYDFTYSIRSRDWSQFGSILNFRFLKKVSCMWPLQILNELKNLELLEMHIGNWFIKTDLLKKLTLPELKAIDFQVSDFFFTTNHKYELELETPKLKEVTLDVTHFDSIKFNYPLAVTQLRTYSYDARMAIFKNLELFEFRFDLNPDFLVNFPKLSVLKISTIMDVSYLPEFIQKCNESSIANLRIYYLGIEMLVGDDQDSEKLDILKRMPYEINRMPFYLKAYESLDDNLPDCPEVVYGDLLKAMPKIPADFFRKFSNINSIKVSVKIEDPDRLLEFIGGCRNLTELTLTNTGLNQDFYNRLNSSLFTLKVLKDSDLRLDFSFLARMRLLHSFETDQELRITRELALASFRYLHTFIFMLYGQPFSAWRSGKNDKYVIKSGVREFPRHSSFGELVRWCDHIKKTTERSKKRVEAWKNGAQFKKSK